MSPLSPTKACVRRLMSLAFSRRGMTSTASALLPQGSAASVSTLMRAVESIISKGFSSDVTAEMFS